MDQQSDYISFATFNKLFTTCTYFSHSLPTLISELEVRGARIHCPLCAILVSVDADLY